MTKVASNDRDPNFKVGEHVRISKKTFFSKSLHSDLVRKVSVIKKVKKYNTMDICSRRP